MDFIKKNLELILIPLIFLVISAIYLFPMWQGLILLPLDLLIGNYAPWYSPATILLKNPYMQDSVAQLYPWRHLVFQSLTDGVIPLWNPYQFLGMPFMAGMKPMVFYPANILFIFGEVKAWNFLLLLQIFLSLIFTYVLVRDFKFGPLAAIFSSIAFAFNSLMIGLLEFGSDAHSILWWPVFFYSVKKYLDTKNKMYVCISSVSVALSIFAGQLQYTAYGLILVLLFIYFYSKSIKTEIKFVLHLFAAIVLGIGISAIQLLPSIELFVNSHRALLSPSQMKDNFTNGLMPPHFILRLISPDYFGNPTTRDLSIGYIETSGYFGIIPLFFLFISFFRRHSFIFKFFALSFIVAILLSIKGIGEIIYWFKIPIITSGTGGRIFSIVLFSGAILSGIGLMEFLTREKRRLKILILAGFTIFIFVSIFTSAFFASRVSDESLASFLRNIRYVPLIWGAFAVIAIAYLFLNQKFKSKALPVLFIIFTIALTFFDLFRFGYRFLTFSNVKFLYPDLESTLFVKDYQKDTLARVYGLTEPELATYLGVYTIETYNPLYLKKTSIFLEALQGRKEINLPVDNKYFLTSGGSDLKYALDLLGVSLIAVSRDENPSIKYFYTPDYQDSFTRIHRDDKYDIYLNSDAYNRFGLFYKNKFAESDDDVLRIIADREIDLRKEIILDKNPPFELEEGTGSAALISSTVNEQKFSIKTDKPAIFYVSDTYFPGWKVRINGKSEEIHKANGNFRAVFVPAGKSIVEFNYLPDSFIIGAGISAASLGSLLAFMGFPLKSRDKKRK